jgi:peptidoglycan-associated lipoprotein
MMYLALAALVTLAACADTNGGYNTAGLEGGSGWNDTDISSEDLNDPASRGYFKNSVGDTVLFDVDEFTLNTASKAALDIQAEWLVSNPGYVIVLEGHADERGTREYNLALGFPAGAICSRIPCCPRRVGPAPKDPQLWQGAAGGNLQL